MPRKPSEPFLPLAKPVSEIPDGSIEALKRRARDCRACPLWQNATQTVFGKGPADAEIMLIGEQPGLQEDIEGEPFVGPAGQMLDRALAEAGLDRATLFLTNTVKHFKYEQRATAKLHKRANAAEQAACRMWLAAELARVRPKIVIALGAMAAQTLFGNAFRLSRDRGEWRVLGEHAVGMATWHPSAILRGRDRKDAMYRQLVADLQSIKTRRR